MGRTGENSALESASGSPPVVRGGTFGRVTSAATNDPEPAGQPSHGPVSDAIPGLDPDAAAAKIQPDLAGANWQSAHDESGEPPAPGRGRIEIAFVEDKICMRNGEDPSGPVLTFTQAEWDAFIAGVQDGEFDLLEEPDQPGA